MKTKSVSLLLLALMAMMSLAFGVLVASRLPAEPVRGRVPGAPLYVDGASWEPRSGEEIAQAGQFPNFVPVVNRALPAVVSVTSTEIVKGRRRGEEAQMPLDPFEFFFGPRPDRQNPEQPPSTFRNVSYGSGFIISPDGYVLTNHHVVADASEITVGLYGTSDTFPAKVVGKDREVDIALLKIDVKGRDLPVLPLGDSDSLQVGEWVLAVGNPFGLPHTVTSGIVSAIGRDIGGSALDAYIQTDAPINQGNSGGPLINLRGEVVGINTLINAYAQNIGFAVPVNMAKRSLPDLRERGRVARGYLGVNIGPLTDDLREGLNLPKDVQGALVQHVVPDMPGDKAGLRAGDVIVEADGVKITDSTQLVREIAQKRPKEKINLKLLREGRTMSVQAVLGDRGSALFDEESEPGRKDETAPAKMDPVKALKIEVAELTSQTRRDLGLPSDVEGVLVTDVDAGGDAYAKGLRRGMVISEANRKKVTSVDGLKKAMEGVKPGQLVLLYAVGRNFRGYVPVRIAAE